MNRHAPRASDSHVRRSNRWITMKELGTKGGGINSGIAIVADRATGKAYIEKGTDSRAINDGYAQREIEIMKQLRGHPHIVSIEDYFLDLHRKQGSIVMEYCSMGALDRLIERHVQAHRRPIGEHHIWNWFIHVADALVLCHYGPNPHDVAQRQSWNTIFHRDIKPANIFLARPKDGPLQGQVIAKLADFGCASTKDLIMSRVSNPLKQSAFTEAFLPPDYPQFKQQSDVWQLGAVVICLCNLRKDPSGYNKTAPAGGQYSDQLNYVIGKCMESNWARRWTSMKLLHELRETYSRIRSSLPRDIEPILPRKQ